LLNKGLSFTEGSAMLNADGRAYLDNVAIFLKEHPEMKILIYGHSCDLGSKQTNLRISKQRAETVRYYLTINGVPQNQIQSEGIADMQPLVPNTSEKNRIKNRRASFVIIK
jgi:outer membrane protein OmpA-like peptidoglycan-associated protein